MTQIQEGKQIWCAVGFSELQRKAEWRMEGLEWSVEGRIERFGVCEVGKVGGGTACWARVLVSGERGRLTRVRRVKRTFVRKERCKRPFVKMPLMHRNDATMQRHAHVNSSMLSFMHTCVHSYMLTM